jgi:putative membrane protein
VLETAPTWIGLVALALTSRRFPLPVWFALILAVHALILAVGAHWTYEHVPFGFWMKEVLGTERNPFDRLGHVFQGITPALLTRELLLRNTPLRGAAVPLLAVAVALAFSALYEHFEWISVVLMGTSAEAFLGLQGDPFDAQADMLCALCGASAAMLFRRPAGAQI